MENQEILFKLSMFEQQLQQLQQQLQAVENGITELNSLSLGLNELPGSKGKEIFARIGRGIYAKAKIISEDLVVNVGENNFVKRSVPETKKMIEEQTVKLKEVGKELESNIESVSSDFTKLAQEYEAGKEKEGNRH